MNDALMFAFPRSASPPTRALRQRRRKYRPGLFLLVLTRGFPEQFPAPGGVNDKVVRRLHAEALEVRPAIIRATRHNGNFTQHDRCDDTALYHFAQI